MHIDTTLVNNKIIRINNIKICSLKANNEDENLVNVALLVMNGEDIKITLICSVN